MMDPETFLVEVYVLADDFSASLEPPPRRRGRRPSLSPSEVLTLGIVGQWDCFPSERAFWRWADRHLRGCFPTLPCRSQLNRLLRQHSATLERFGCWLAARLDTASVPYEILDGTGIPIRSIQRGGRGWLAGEASVGWSTRLRWYMGIRTLLAVDPRGVVTGWGSAPAEANDRAMTDTFLQQRGTADPELTSAGRPAPGGYLADTGFAGRACQARWATAGHTVICPPQPDSHDAWSVAWRTWFAGRRQIVETVIARLFHVFRLDRERPHTLSGFLTRFAAKIGLHNCCIVLNLAANRPPLAVADLIDW